MSNDAELIDGIDPVYGLSDAASVKLDVGKLTVTNLAETRYSISLDAEGARKAVGIIESLQARLKQYEIVLRQPEDFETYPDPAEARRRADARAENNVTGILGRLDVLNDDVEIVALTDPEYGDIQEIGLSVAKLRHVLTERIAAVAVKHDDLIISRPAPARHNDIIHPLNALTNRLCPCEDQGFLTNSGRFVDRREAVHIARCAGQLPKGAKHPPLLYSEDLW